MIILNIDVTKIPKEAIQTNPNWKGKFLKLKLVDFPKDDNDGFIAVDQTKEQREAKEKSAIVGNWKHVGQKPSPPAPKPQRSAPAPAQRNPVDPDLDAPEEDDIPF